MNRTFLPLLLCTLLLAGCMQSEEPPEAELIPTAPAALATQTVQTNGPVVITFGVPQIYQPRFVPLVAAFNAANDDVRVQFVTLPENNDDDTMRAVASAADTAAVSSVSATAIAHEYVRDLKPLIDADAAFQPQDYFPNLLRPYGDNQAVYLLPHTVYVPTLSYNKDLWAAQGLAAPAANWTWPDVLADAAQLARTGTSPNQVVYGLLDTSGGVTALRAALTAANLRPDPAAPALRLDSPALVAAFQQLQRLFKTGAISSVDDLATDPRALVAAGRIGIWPTRALYGAPDQPEQQLPFATAVAPLPPSFGDDTLPTEGYVMSNATQHPEAAWRWLAFLSHHRVDQLAGPLQSRFQLPARSSLADQSGYWSKLDAETSAVVRAALMRPAAVHAAPTGTAATTSPYGALVEALHAVTMQQQSPEQALAHAQQQYEQLALQVQKVQPTPDLRPLAVATPVPQAGSTATTYFSLSADATVLRTLAAAFQAANPDMAIAVSSGASGTRPQNLHAAATRADCFDWPVLLQPNDSAALLDLQPLIDADATFPRDDYAPALMERFQIQGRQYGLPAHADVPLLVYKPAAFADAQVAEPTATWTLADIEDAAQRLRSISDQPFDTGSAPYEITDANLVALLESTGVAVVRQTDQGPQPNYTDPGVQTALQHLIEAMQPGAAQHAGSPAPTSPAANGAAVAVSEHSAMWSAPGLGALLDAPQTIAVAPLPGALASPPDVIGRYISAGAKQVETCWRWINFLNAQDTSSAGGFPARRSVAGSKAFLDHAPAGTQAVVVAAFAAWARTAPRPDTSALDFFWFDRAVDRALHGKDLARELADAQQFTEAYLVCTSGGTAGPACATQADPTYAGFQQAAP